MNPATDHIIAALREAREKKAISQRELSARSGVPQAQISRLESGAVDIRLSSLVALSRALDLEIELVPRKALAAVESIVRTATSSEPSAPNLRSATNEIAKLSNALQTIRIQTPDFSALQLDKTIANLRMLERFRLSTPQLDSIKKFSEAVSKMKALDFDIDLIAKHAKEVQALRNQIAHAPAPASLPKPAYSLDDDEDDDA